MKKRKFGKLFGIFLLAAGLVGFTGCRCKSPEDKAEWVTSKIKRKLDLTDDQAKKLDVLKVKYLETRKKYKADKKKRYAEIKEMVLAGSLDEAKVKDMISNHQKKIDTEFPEFFPLVAEFHASLNDEQKQTAVEFMEKFHKRHHCDDEE